MSHLTGRQPQIRQGLCCGAVLLVCALLAARAGAAPPTPASFTNCSGTLAKDPAATPTSDDPTLTDYTIHCDQAITSYTILVNRGPWDQQTIDDLTADVSILDPGGVPNATENITCSADLPGDGFNCNAGAGGQVLAWRTVGGSFDLTEPYCKHFPTGARPGMLAVPRALVQLVVTDYTGAEDGPFALNLASACPAVPDRVPFPKPKPKPRKSTHKKASKVKRR